MTPTATGAGQPIPAGAIPRLTAIAARIAARQHVNLADVAAVATTQAGALQLLLGGTQIPGSEHVPVYVMTMTGRFISIHAPYGSKPPEGTVMTVILDARTLDGLDTKISNQDDRALLPQLGPVTILPAVNSAPACGCSQPPATP